MTEDIPAPTDRGPAAGGRARAAKRCAECHARLDDGECAFCARFAAAMNDAPDAGANSLLETTLAANRQDTSTDPP